MFIKIIKSNNGCAFKKGQVIQTNDKRGENLIRQGFAKAISGTEVRRSPDIHPNTVLKRDATMEPPRYICRCGLVCNSSGELRKHQSECK